MNVLKPLFWVFLLIRIVCEPLFKKTVDIFQSSKVKYIPLSMFTISNKFVLIAKSIEFGTFSFFEVSVKLSLLVFLGKFLGGDKIIVHVWVLFDLVVDGYI